MKKENMEKTYTIKNIATNKTAQVIAKNFNHACKLASKQLKAYGEDNEYEEVKEDLTLKP